MELKHVLYLITMTKTAMDEVIFSHFLSERDKIVCCLIIGKARFLCKHKQSGFVLYQCAVVENESVHFQLYICITHFL